jgi:putative ABC transport system permease protein
MLRSYISIALRYLRKNTIFSLLNVMGLAIGLACCILIALWAMHSWLQDFAYRAPFAGWEFLLPGVMTLLIALITVSSRAVRAALANPIKVLRSE